MRIMSGAFADLSRGSISGVPSGPIGIGHEFIEQLGGFEPYLEAAADMASATVLVPLSSLFPEGL